MNHTQNSGKPVLISDMTGKMKRSIATVAVAVLIAGLGAGSAHGALVTTYYDFEGTGADRFDDPAGAFADDLTGGTGSAAFSSDTPGVIGGSQSASFDGSYTLSTGAHTTDLRPGNDAFTVMFWIKAADNDQENNNTRLMSTSTGASGNPYWQVEGFGNDGTRGDRLDLRIQNKPSGFGNWFSPDATNALANQGESAAWRHVAIVNSNTGSPNDGGAYAETFVDGSSVGLADMGSSWDGFTIGNSAGRLTIGGPGTGNGNRDFTGLLDDIALFDGVVSDADIAAIAAGTLKPFVIPEPAPGVMMMIGLGALCVRRRRRG